MSLAKTLRRFRWRAALLLVAIALLAFFGFGISANDESAFRSFTHAVKRWQTDPEFRAIATEYAQLGSGAVRTHPWGVPTRRLILSIRAFPLLPKRYAVNPTSDAHYTHFGQGPLVAYLHLCGEQSVPDFIGVVEAAGKKRERSESDDRTVLDAFKMDFPVDEDEGALRSAEAMLRDTDAARPFAIRTNIGDLLRPHIAALAAELHLPAAPEQMTPLQQRAVLDRLDDYVRHHDPELWRTKQVSDFAGGVWAQVFGPPYNSLLVPFLIIHDVCRIALAVGLVLVVSSLLWRRRRADGAGRNQPGAE